MEKPLTLISHSFEIGLDYSREPDYGLGVLVRVRVGCGVMLGVTGVRVRVGQGVRVNVGVGLT